jgi:hypothetical protein
MSPRYLVRGSLRAFRPRPPACGLTLAIRSERRGRGPTCCLEGRFRQGASLDVPRSDFVCAAPWMTPDDRSFPPVLAWKWHDAR